MLPPVRKGSAFPASFTKSLREAQPREGSLGQVIGKAEPYRTEGGGAAKHKKPRERRRERF